MSRVPFAAAAGIAGFVAYIGLAVIVADRVLTAHWLAQLLYFAVAGALWVFPVRWLMLWAANKR